VTINGMHSSNMAGSYAHCPGTNTDTATILLDSGISITNTTILSTGSDTSAKDIVLDCFNGIPTMGSTSNEYALAQYTLGPKRTVYFNTNVGPSYATNPVAPTTTLDLSQGYLLQYACTSGTSPSHFRQRTFSRVS
jgi:hypothetical protein